MKNIKKSIIIMVAMMLLVGSAAAAIPPNDMPDNVQTVYYAAANGLPSNSGTSADSPIDLTTALNISGSNSGILLRSGDTFYSVNNTPHSNITYLGSYGDGPKPVISGAKIIRNTNSNNLENWSPDGNGNYTNAWTKGTVSDVSWSAGGGGDIWRIDLSVSDHFSGITTATGQYLNIGFIEDVSNGQKYGARKETLAGTTQDGDFYCETTHAVAGQYLYLKSDTDPNKKKLILTANNHLLQPRSNTTIDGLHLRYTGGHGIVSNNWNVSEYHNVMIRNCIIEDIGGSVHAGKFTRYGNGIEFGIWQSNSTVRDVTINNNIIRNCYDAAITPQGGSTGLVNYHFRNIKAYNNILVANVYSTEQWNRNPGTTLEYEHYNNLHINQGRCWGYDTRPDKESNAEFSFWFLQTGDSIKSYNNTLFNPRTLFLTPSSPFSLSDSRYALDNNIMYLQDGIVLTTNGYGRNIRNFYGNNLSNLNSCNIEQNSKIITITQNDLDTKYSSQAALSMASNDYDAIWNAFQK